MKKENSLTQKDDIIGFVIVVLFFTTVITAGVLLN